MNHDHLKAGMSRAQGAASTLLLAVDTGGTFTDVLLLDRGELRSLKVPSSPADPAAAVLEGIRSLLPDGATFVLVHGSTVATNALLERKGARVILVTNRGFEDVIEIGRQNRPQLYALSGYRPPPLVAREDRIGIAGRLDPDGREVEELDAEELEQLPSRVEGADALAVCLLHAYANPAHENRVRGALEDLEAHTSISSQLLPEYREYERTSTTVVNAYVAPLMSRYLGRLDEESRARRVTVMGSNGGALPVSRARREPVHTILSGPAGGVVGGLTWARRAGFEKIISFDMGGTSTDVSLCPGRPLRTREFEIAGQPVAVPVIDIHTVGAGGGSLARLDPGGALRVGPRSAGADPGPICYGRGGTGLTVTDAHVWLGRLPADAFLGGLKALEKEAIEPHLSELARGLADEPEAAAEGILRVADSAMERALRVISVERGYDPGEFVLVAFGGAGGLHVAELTGRLGAARALVPPEPGLLSAYGMLAAPVTREVSRTLLLKAGSRQAEERMSQEFKKLEAAAIQHMEEEGISRDAMSLEHSVDARYQGQSFELRVPRKGWVEEFHRLHQERYGYRRDDAPIEAVTLRVVVEAPGAAMDPPRLPTQEGRPPSGGARVWFRGDTLEADRIERSDLRAGHVLEGPTVVVEYSSTTWLPPRWRLEVDEWGCLHLIPPS